jgi:predicted nucleotidyltransferase
VTREDVESRIDLARLDSLAHRQGLLLVAIFGSLAKGRATERSDVDIGVLIERRPLDALNWELELEADLCSALPGREVDLTVLNDASAALRFEVARTGVAIFERTAGTWSRFRSYAARAYYDEEPRRRRQERYLAGMHP